MKLHNLKAFAVKFSVKSSRDYVSSCPEPL